MRSTGSSLNDQSASIQNPFFFFFSNENLKSRKERRGKRTKQQQKQTPKRKSCFSFLCFVGLFRFFGGVILNVQFIDTIRRHSNGYGEW
mmetsp:Transcript_30414/g.73914  ORF Transcript_30414/g.73914 Transcript_30414/m.73914 type:complete len:89 (-) Transcript_30414:631-897(-)